MIGHAYTATNGNPVMADIPRQRGGLATDVGRTKPNNGITEVKRCVGCGDYKNKYEFYASSAVKDAEDGLNRYCKHCCKVNRAMEGVRKRDRRSKISMRQRHRAGVLGVECDDTITLVKVFKKDAGMCQLCTKWVQPRHASMDHRYPLSKGGTHTWGNVQLTHLLCNLRKGDRI